MFMKILQFLRRYTGPIFTLRLQNMPLKAVILIIENVLFSGWVRGWMHEGLGGTTFVLIFQFCHLKLY